MFTLLRNGDPTQLGTLLQVVRVARPDDPVYVSGRGWMTVGDLRGTRARHPRPRTAGPAHRPRRPGEFTGGRVPCPLTRRRSRLGANVLVETGTRG